MDQLERNKKNVMAFYDLMFNQCKPAEAVENYTGNRYMQHNPAVADGKDALSNTSSAWPRNIRVSVCTSSAPARFLTSSRAKSSKDICAT